MKDELVGAIINTDEKKDIGKGGKEDQCANCEDDIENFIRKCFFIPHCLRRVLNCWEVASNWRGRFGGNTSDLLNVLLEFIEWEAGADFFGLDGAVEFAPGFGFADLPDVGGVGYSFIREQIKPDYFIHHPTQWTGGADGRTQWACIFR